MNTPWCTNFCSLRLSACGATPLLSMCSVPSGLCQADCQCFSLLSLHKLNCSALLPHGGVAWRSFKPIDLADTARCHRHVVVVSKVRKTLSFKSSLLGLHWKPDAQVGKLVQLPGVLISFISARHPLHVALCLRSAPCSKLAS